MAFTNYRGFGSILKTEDLDDGTIKVYGIASTASRDHADEIVTSDAMKAALPNYSKHPALREQHDAMKAAGRTIDAFVDDDGSTQIEAHVVDPVAIAKVKAGVYSGFSIGGKVTKRDPSDRSIITALTLVEISLVDSPCNPDATLNMWKADMTNYSPSSDEVVAKAKQMAAADGRKAYKDYVYQARQELTALGKAQAAADEAAAEAAETAEVVDADEAAKAEFAAALDASVEGVEAAAADPAAVIEPTAEDAAKAAAPDPAAALADVIAKAQAAVADPAPEAEDIAAELTKGATVLRVLAGKAETDLAKGLYTVSRFAEIIDAVVSVQASCTYEAQNEGDKSPVPAAIAASVAALCVNLRDMVAEETAEILATYTAAGIDIDFDAAEDASESAITDLALAAATADLVKADTALMEKAGARHSKADAAKIQSMHDHAVALGANCKDEPESQGAEEDHAKAAMLAENERLAKALADAAPAVEEITKAFSDKFGMMAATIETLTKRLEAVEATPAAPKAAASALRNVTKAEDINPGATPQHAAPAETEDMAKFRTMFEALSPAEQGELQVRAALRTPHVIKRGA